MQGNERELVICRGSLFLSCEPIHKKAPPPPPPPPPLANKRERGIFSCLRMATRNAGNMFRREMFKTFGAQERVASNNPADTLQLFSSRSRWIVGFILFLSHTSLFEQKDNHIIRLDYFQTDDFLASKQFLLILWICDCRRPPFSLPPPPCLLQAAILLKITLLIVVRSKAIPKSGGEVGI